MAAPRQLLLMDVPGLTVADVRSFGPHVPHLHALAQNCAAAIVPIAAGSTPARQASLATGVLPQDHGLVFGGIEAPWHGRTFWQRAQSSVPGLKTAFFGNCAQLARASDVHLRSEGSRLVCHPPHVDPFFQQGLGNLDLGEHFEQVFAHFATRAMAGGYGFVWVENARMTIARIVRARVGDASEDAPELRKLDAFVGGLLAAAGDRVVVLMSIACHAPGNHGVESPGLPQAKCMEDGRILHVHCTPDQVPTITAQLRAKPGFGRVLGGSQRGELGLDCPEAGAVLAELQPGSGFINQYVREPSAPVGPDDDPGEFGVFLARGMTLPKTTIGTCEVAWVLQHVLTGAEYRDEG